MQWSMKVNISIYNMHTVSQRLNWSYGQHGKARQTKSLQNLQNTTCYAKVNHHVFGQSGCVSNVVLHTGL